MLVRGTPMANRGYLVSDKSQKDTECATSCTLQYKYFNTRHCKV